jgi:hypothetical protein
LAHNTFPHGDITCETNDKFVYPTTHGRTSHLQDKFSYSENHAEKYNTAPQERQKAVLGGNGTRRGNADAKGPLDRRTKPQPHDRSATAAWYLMRATGYA